MTQKSGPARGSSLRSELHKEKLELNQSHPGRGPGDHSHYVLKTAFVAGYTRW